KGWQYFQERYDRKRHRTRFKGFLQTLLTGRSFESAETAEFLREVLDPTGVESEQMHRDRRIWLRSFFCDEPTLELKLKAWIVRMVKLKRKERNPPRAGDR